jgi:hypothetical protein
MVTWHAWPRAYTFRHPLTGKVMEARREKVLRAVVDPWGKAGHVRVGWLVLMWGIRHEYPRGLYEGYKRTDFWRDPSWKDDLPQ